MNARAKAIEDLGFSMRGGRLVCRATGVQVEATRDPTRSSTVIVHLPGQGMPCNCTECQDSRMRTPIPYDFYRAGFFTANSIVGWLADSGRPKLEIESMIRVLLLLAATGESRFRDVFDWMEAREQPAPQEAPQ